MSDDDLIKELNNITLKSVLTDEELRYNKEIINEISYRLIYYANKVNESNVSKSINKNN